MKSFLLKITLLLFTAIFVLSTTGVFFIEHHCAQEQETDIHFVKNTSGNCCEHITMCCTTEKTHEMNVCCEAAAGGDQEHNSGIADNNCCVNKIVYIKTISPDFNNTVSKFLSFVPIVFTNQTLTCKLVIENFEIPFYKPPPKTLTQRIVSTSSLLL